MPPPPPAAATPERPSPRYTATFFSRYEYRQGYDVLGVSRGRFLEGDAVAYRARLGLSLPAIDIGGGRTASAVFRPQASGFWGQPGNTLDDPALGIHEGYLRIASSRLTLDAGRFVMNQGDALVIGNLEWHESARSFDGMRIAITPAGGQRIELFATQNAEGRPTGEFYGNGDNYFYGVHAALGPMLSKTMALDVYAFGLTSPKTPDVPVDPLDPGAGTDVQDAATLVTLGTRIKNKRGALDYRLEAGVQMGQAVGTPGQDNPSAFAYHADGEIGLTMASGRARAALELLYASGDDPDTADKREGWNQLFPTGHKFLGLSDVAGARTNIYSGVLHLQYKVAERTMAKLDGHVFARPHRVNGATGYAGSELDAQLIHTLGKGLKLRGLYAVFLPDEDIYGVSDPAHFLEIELRYDLK